MIEAIGWIASVFTLLSVLLVAQKNILCWPTQLTGNILWFIYAAKTTQVPLMIINVVFMVTSTYGWYRWRKDKNESI